MSFVSNTNVRVDIQGGMAKGQPGQRYEFIVKEHKADFELGSSSTEPKPT